MRVNVQASDDPIDYLSEQMGQMMKELMDRNFFRSCTSETWQPAMNVYEVPDRWVVCLELAGMSAEEIDLFVADRILHIRGVRPKPRLAEPQEQVSVHVMEINSGRFHRRVSLPEGVDSSKIEAHYRNGYLWVSVPKTSAHLGG